LFPGGRERWDVLVRLHRIERIDEGDHCSVAVEQNEECVRGQRREIVGGPVELEYQAVEPGGEAVLELADIGDSHAAGEPALNGSDDPFVLKREDRRIGQLPVRSPPVGLHRLDQFAQVSR